MKRGGLGLAGALGFSAVAFGAFGAHGLRARLSPAMLEVYRTGALYHLVHAVAALAVALAGERLRRGRLILTLFMAGIVVFAGSLYALAITGVGVARCGDTARRPAAARRVGLRGAGSGADRQNLTRLPSGSSARPIAPAAAVYGLQTPVEVSIFQLVAQVVETVVPLMVNGSQM